MSEKMWYYIKDNKRKGPKLQSTMQEMFDRGVLEAETLIWSESLSEWLPASKVVDFKVSISPSPPPLPKLDLPPTPYTESLAKTENTTDVAQVRPWVRYWARMIDICLFSLPAGFVLGIVFPSILKMPGFAFGMLLIFAWIFVEASLLSTWGSTPGKALFKTTVRSSTGEILSFSNALNRSFSVWWRGLGTGFPIVSLATLEAANKHLSKDGITSWDREGNFAVSHNRIGVLRVIIAIIFFVGVLLLILIGTRFGMGRI